MAHLNKTCWACKTKFSHCPDCSRADALKPSWASEFCSEPCMTLWTTLTKFGMNRLTKSEAKSIIAELDLKPIDTYAACVQRDYNKVMAAEKKSRKAKKIEPVVEVEPIVADLVVEPDIIIEQPIEVVVVEDHTEHEVVIKENE